MDMFLDLEYRESAAAEIRRLRRKHALTPAEFSRVIGSDHAMVSRIERGLAGVSRRMVERVVVGLGLTEHAANRLRLAAGFAPKKRRGVGDDA